ncbi:MAG: hypothetical protein HY749_15445 [Gammaproteobacteria bacterium]|nr:hypothetical protein [Gammaproteobacteria bacterium]MBI5617340.1 hypothetical protein [Gammaproteobacteria bacterium]
MEDRTSRGAAPTTSSTARKPAPLAAPDPTKPAVAVVKPLAMPAEPKLIPIPVPESAPAPAPVPATPGVPTAPAAAPGMELAAIPPALSSSAVSPEQSAAAGEGDKQYRPNAAVGELLSKAKGFEQKRDFPGAITILERGVQVAPNDPMLWHQLARMRFANGELAQAKRLAERSNSLARSFPAITTGNWMLIGQVEKLAGNAEAAQRAFSNAQPGHATQ